MKYCSKCKKEKVQKKVKTGFVILCPDCDDINDFDPYWNWRSFNDHYKKKGFISENERILMDLLISQDVNVFNDEKCLRILLIGIIEKGNNPNMYYSNQWTQDEIYWKVLKQLKIEGIFEGGIKDEN